MLNEERIKLMTKMASYEANEGKRNVAIGSYFRGDYISLQVIKSIVSATIAFAICFALFVFYDFEVSNQLYEDGEEVSGFAAPCGVCRQVMIEFCNPEEFQIIVAKSEKEFQVFTLEELFPEGFGPNNL